MAPLADDEEFSELYDRARKVLVEKEVEKILIISDEYPTIEQTIFGTKGREASYTQIDPAGISRNKLRVDTRKFLITKILPKFKDKLEVEAGPDLAQILGASMAVK